MIESQTRRIYLTVQFGVMLGFVKLKAKSFQCIYLPEQFNNFKFQTQRAAYIFLRR